VNTNWKLTKMSDTILSIYAWRVYFNNQRAQSPDQTDNQQLNTKMSFELIVRTSKTRHFTEPPVTAGVERVSFINVLGVHISNNLSNGLNTERVLHKASQSLYALKVLNTNGLSPGLLIQVCAATMVSYLTYAAPSWHGFSKTASRPEQSLSLRVAWFHPFCSP